MSDTQAQAEDRRARAKALARDIFDLESTGGMDDLAFLEGRARAVIEAELSRLSRVEQALREALTQVLDTDFMRDGQGVRQPIAIRFNRVIEIVRAALSASPEAQPEE